MNQEPKVRGKQLMPTVADLRDYIIELKKKADAGDLQAMHALLDLNRHKVELSSPEPRLTREQELANKLNIRRG
ncbi:hypothetical protein [Vibrio rumoiensis]|uniref:hypothetical protein n=1 Tax=Vibrio rumoiensis TaxID=76258 RepID=UPI003AA8E70F